MSKIDKAIEELKNAVIEESGCDVVAFDLFVSHSEIELKKRIKRADALKSEGISMRNLSGEWIK